MTNDVDGSAASDCSFAVPPPESPSLQFKAIEYRVPTAGEYFWADGDVNPGVCKMFEGMNLSYHNDGRRWILAECW
jgi:hypothetical protein